MKYLIGIILFFSGINSAFSQTDSLFLKNYEQKILEIKKVENDLQIEKQRLSELSEAYKTDTLALNKQIKELQNEVSSEKEKVSKLNKSKVKNERNNLKKEVDSLRTVISIQNETIAKNNQQIETEKQHTKTLIVNAENKGEAKVLEIVAEPYNRSFDELIRSSTKESVTRDIQLVGNKPEIKQVLDDLLIYFETKELLLKKLNDDQVKTILIQLDQIKRPSKLLDALKEDIEYYKDYNDALKETIGKLVDLDNRKSADGDPEIQKMKFNEIATILTAYMYNYYDYTKYPYLSDIVVEIIKRKGLNADDDIKDLLKKL